MKSLVTAVVVAHDQPDYLSVTLQALANQITKPARVVILDSSIEDACQKITSEYSDFEYRQISDDANLKEIIDSFIDTESATNSLSPWIWLLHDDSAPEKAALQELLQVVERSPSAALVGPKQLSWQNPRQILQLGLTLAPNGDLFTLVAGELDQGQHDSLDDVLAVGTAGVLLKTEVYQQLGGLDPKAPPLAADIDLSIRARLAGHRVLVAPRAKVIHAALALSGQRPRGWLRVSPKAAIRRAEIHLKLTYNSAFSTFFYWLFLPLLALARSISALVVKRPDRIVPEIGASIWGWFTILARLSSRRRMAKNRTFAFSKLNSLRADWRQVRASRRAKADANNFVDTESDESGSGAGDQGEPRGKGLFESKSILIALALLILSASWWPRNIAAVGGGLLPLGQNWIDVFNRAGASYQHIGIGFIAPSDPFVWVLTAISALTFWAPSLSVAMLMLLVKPLAFIAFFKLASNVTRSTLARNVAALVYALWPVVLEFQNEARLPILIAYLALPWFANAVIRVAGFGDRSARASAQQRVTWVALAGLLLAVIAASAPIAGLISIFGLGLIALTRIKRLGYLIWVALPTAALFGPTVIFYSFKLLQPLALLADPGLPQQTSKTPYLDLALPFAGLENMAGIEASWLIFAIVLLALPAIFIRRAGLVTTLTISSFVLIALSLLISRIQVPAVGVGSTGYQHQTVFLTAGNALIFVALLTGLIFAIFFGDLRARRFKAIYASFLSLLLVAPALVFTYVNPNSLSYTDARAVPSIVQAEALAGSQLKLLALSPSVSKKGAVTYAAELVNGDGVQLEDVSVSYRFAVAQITSESSEFTKVSQLVADLASASGASLQGSLESLGLGFILVPKSNSTETAELSFALDSVAELESVGVTDYGQLWRVREPNQKLLNAKPESTADWSITKAVQLSILAAFVLLALPSRTSGRRKVDDTEIFVDANEEAE